MPRIELTRSPARGQTERAARARQPTVCTRAPRRRTVSALPSSSIDSKSGGETRRPLVRDAQRAVGDARLQAEAALFDGADERAGEGVLDAVRGEFRLGDELERADGGDEHLARVRGQGGERVLLVRDLVREEEAEEPRSIAQQLHALLDERCGSEREHELLVRRLRLARAEDVGLDEVRQHPLREVLLGEHPDVVAVDRLGLLLVEAGGVRVDVDDVERRDELVAREDVAIGSERPAEQRQVVEQALVDEAARPRSRNRSALGSRFESFLVPVSPRTSGMCAKRGTNVVTPASTSAP